MKRTLCRGIANLIYILATILLLLLVIVPVAVSLSIQFGFFPSSQSANWWLHGLQVVQVRAMHIICWAWVFFVGGCFASFLNVVAYRVPRSQSILGSSHCPQCRAKLTFRNNLPILGWLRNGGHCANCDLPIPVRYLVAEIMLGSIFLLLFLTQTITGGATIPFRAVNQFTGIENILFAPQADLLVILGFHLVLVSLIFTFALIASENFQAPISIVAFGVLSAIAFQLSAPSPGMLDFRLASLTSTDSPDFIKLGSDWQSFAIAICIAVGIAAFCFGAVKLTKVESTNGVFASLVLIAIFLGWQATLSVTIIFLALSCFGILSSAALVLISTVAHLCLWRLQVACSWWPGPGSDYPQLFAAAGYIAVLAFLLRLRNSRQKNKVHVDDNLPIVSSDLQ